MEEIKDKKLLFFIFIGAIFFLGGIGYFNYAGIKQKNTRDILLLDADENQVVFNSHKDLIHTDINGNVISQISLKKLGIKKHLLSDIKIVDGKLYMAHAKTKQILKCALPLKTCEEFAKIKSKEKIGSYDIAFNKDKFYIADCYKDRIHIFDKNGKFIKKIELKKEVEQITDIIIENNNTFITNLENGKIAKIENEKIVQSFMPKIQLSSITHAFPFSIALDNKKNLWVVMKDMHMENGTVRVFNKDFKELEYNFNFREPTNVASNNKFIFVSDSGLYNIIKFDTFGNTYPFVSNLQSLSDHRAKKEYWQSQEKLSIYLIIFGTIILAIISLFLALQKAKEEMGQKNNEALLEALKQRSYAIELAKDENGIIWLRRDGGVKMFLIALAIFVAFEIFVILLQDPFVIALTTLLNLTVGGFVIYAYLLEKNEAIGIKGEEIHLQNAFKSKCITTAKEIVLKDKLSFLELSSKGVKVKLAINMQNTNIGYDKDEIIKYLLPLLKENKILGALESIYLEAKNRTVFFILKIAIFISFASLALFMVLEQRVFTLLLKSFLGL